MTPWRALWNGLRAYWRPPAPPADSEEAVWRALRAEMIATSSPGRWVWFDTLPPAEQRLFVRLWVREVCAGRITLPATRRARVYRFWCMLEVP